MYNIQAGNLFGQSLLDLIKDEYESVDDGLYTIAAAFQEQGFEVDDEQIVSLIEADEIDIEQEEFEIMASVFDQTDNADVYNGLLAIAMESANMIDLEAELEDEDEEVEYDVEEEYAPVGDYSASKRGTASFSAPDPRVAALEARLATVETFSVVKDRLANINARCEFGMQSGWLPPVAKEALVANFNREEDMVASFSKLAAKNNVDLDTQLHAMEFTLEVFERCGNLVDFNQYVNEDIDPAAVQHASYVDGIAKSSLQSMGLFNK